MKFIIATLVLFISCHPAQKITNPSAGNSINLKNEGPWKTNFKNEVFSKILFKMYGNEFVSCCLSKDASGSANYDWLNYDTLTAKNIDIIVTNFMDNKFIKGTIEGVPVYLNFALEFRLSYQLDSITGIYYEHFKKASIQ